jgi:hypothetical protein
MNKITRLLWFNNNAERCGVLSFGIPEVKELGELLLPGEMSIFV